MRLDTHTLSPRPLRPRRTRIVLSMTPLIDVVFILLVFFMLVSQFTTWRSIALDPVAQGTGSVASEVTQLVVELDSNGHVNLAGSTYTDVPSTVAAIHAHRQNAQPILIRPGVDVRIQPLVDLVEALTQSGITQLHVETATTP